jgi:excisionase family DNA binding protein
MMKPNSSKQESQETTWLETKDAAKHIKVPVSSVYQLTHLNQIPHQKIGRRLRFRKSDLDRWLESKSQPVIKKSFIYKHTTRKA